MVIVFLEGLTLKEETDHVLETEKDTVEALLEEHLENLVTRLGYLQNFNLHLEARVEDQGLVVEVVAMVLDQLVQPSSNGFSFIYFFPLNLVGSSYRCWFLEMFKVISEIHSIGNVLQIWSYFRFWVKAVVSPLKNPAWL